MNSRDRVLAALELQEPDRVPVVPFIITFAAKHTNIKFIDYCTKADKIVESQFKTANDFDIDAVYVDSDPVIEAEAMGGQANYYEDEVPTIKGAFVQSVEDIRLLKKPDPLIDGRMPVWIEAIEKLKRQSGKEYAVFSNINGPFQIAAQLRGITNICVDFYRNPETVDSLMDLATDVAISFVKAEVKAGADAVVMGEAMASPNVISPKQFERFVLPYDKRVIEAGGKTPFFLHICGDSTLIIDHMVSTDARFLEVDAQVNLADIRRKYGNTVGIRGNISTTLLLTGEPKQVEVECKKCIEAAANGGGFILGSGCELPKNTPPRNLKAMVRTAENYGKYT